jgi:glycerol-3-phosphate dehydrogenase
MRQVAVIGGGINGLCSAWALAKAGYAVTLYERDQIMRATSAASTKLLHGGLRYLEQGEFRLVREALRERAWWLSQVPEITQAIELVAFQPVGYTTCTLYRTTRSLEHYPLCPLLCL